MHISQRRLSLWFVLPLELAMSLFARGADVITEGRLSNRAVAIAEEHRRREKNPDDFTVDKVLCRFHVRNGSLAEVVTALRFVGIDVCMEWGALQRREWHLDADGAPVLATDKLFNLQFDNAPARKILDAICAADERYTWSTTRQGSLVNLQPKAGSALTFRIASFEDQGSPDDILRRLTHSQPDLKVGNRLKLLMRGTALPKSFIKFRDGTARDLLNLLVEAHPSMIWNEFSQSLTFSYLPDPMVDEVELDFPVTGRVAKFDQFQLPDYQVFPQKHPDGIMRLIVKKKSKRTVR